MGPFGRKRTKLEIVRSLKKIAKLTREEMIREEKRKRLQRTTKRKTADVVTLNDKLPDW